MAQRQASKLAHAVHAFVVWYVMSQRHSGPASGRTAPGTNRDVNILHTLKVAVFDKADCGREPKIFRTASSTVILNDSMSCSQDDLRYETRTQLSSRDSRTGCTSKASGPACTLTNVAHSAVLQISTTCYE